jgi:hypothetical protein
VLDLFRESGAEGFVKQLPNLREAVGRFGEFVSDHAL